MIAIRQIRENEGQAYLEALCRHFGLSAERSARAFFGDPLYDLKKRWAVFEDDAIVATASTTPVRFGWGEAIGIAGVSTRVDRRGQGLAGALLERILAEEGLPAMLLARREDLYRRYGFEVCDRVVRAPLRYSGLGLKLLAPEVVESSYTAWSAEDPARLVRDGRRWEYWYWHGRFCEAFGDGYVCREGGLVREAIGSAPVVPAHAPLDWLGLSSLLPGLPLAGPPRDELLLMARASPLSPVLFMTDQF